MNAGRSNSTRLRAAGAGLAMALALVAAPATARAAGGRATAYGARADRAVMNSRLVAALAKVHAAIPAFSRQTHLACSVCHYQFPALTPFGREFKLNGYTMTGLPTIVAPTDTSSDPSLKLLTVPPMAFMFVGSVTSTAKAIPGTQNGTAQFPDQASVFIGGALTPNLGMFSQFTYAQSDGGFGVDNVDIRYAKHYTAGGHDLLFGLDVNNNPTVQDVWNTVPAWGFPYMGSATAPGPMASSIIDGGLGQASVGLGAYTMLDDKLYTEFSLYRSAPQGGAQPLDSTAANTTEGVAPYWRVAWQHQMSSDYLMLGTFGLYAQLYPAGISGLTNKYTDLGFDAQWEHPSGDGAVIGHASYIHETQDRTSDALNGLSANTNDNLSTFRANLQLATSLKYGASLGYFQTSGTTDALVYAPGDVFGSANGSPNTQGFVAEVDYNTWQNTRVGLQYTAYTKFNGLSSNYDGSGRSASDNNTLYAYFWIAF
ncbi:MAG: cytochrome C [Gemmatimonadota bacterium]|nr:cytochrome C [Gemmatimonadota bacterium]